MGEISQFGLLFKDTGIFGGEIWFVIRALKGFDVDVLDFQIELR